MDGLLGVAGIIIISDDWDHSRKFPASNAPVNGGLSIAMLDFHLGSWCNVGIPRVISLVAEVTAVTAKPKMCPLMA